MGWPSGGGGRRRSPSATYFVLFLVFAAAFTGRGTAARMARHGGVAPAEEEDYTWDPVSSTAPRRGLVGPGSSPPTCRSRCGGCHPCRPVHVAIQPGRSFLLEYYPVAWRCKCGNKLYMP